MVKNYQACVYRTKLSDGEIEWWIVTEPSPLAGIIAFIEGETINEERFNNKGYHIIKKYNTILYPAKDRIAAERTYSRIRSGNAWSIDVPVLFDVYPELYEDVKKGKCEIYMW